MSYIKAQVNWRFRLGVVFLAIFGVVTATLPYSTITYASADNPVAVYFEDTVMPQQQHEQGRDPEANLSYLFAVFFITWAVFFGYVFFISRRQIEMKREIEELKKIQGREGTTVVWSVAAAGVWAAMFR